MSGWNGHWYLYDIRPKRTREHHDYELNSEGEGGVFGPHWFYDFTNDDPDAEPKRLPRRLDDQHIDVIHEAILRAFKKTLGIDLSWSKQEWT
jgi:hypothetical protein